DGPSSCLVSAGRRGTASRPCRRPRHGGPDPGVRVVGQGDELARGARRPGGRGGGSSPRGWPGSRASGWPPLRPGCSNLKGMTDLSPRLRPVLDSMSAYQPGKAPVAVAGGEAHKLSSNESPYGPLPSVLSVLAETGGGMNRYPDSGAAALTTALAERFAVP